MPEDDLTFPHEIPYAVLEDAIESRSLEEIVLQVLFQRLHRDFELDVIYGIEDQPRVTREDFERRAIAIPARCARPLEHTCEDCGEVGSHVLYYMNTTLCYRCIRARVEALTTSGYTMSFTVDDISTNNLKKFFRVENEVIPDTIRAVRTSKIKTKPKKKKRTLPRWR